MLDKQADRGALNIVEEAGLSFDWLCHSCISGEISVDPCMNEDRRK